MCRDFVYQERGKMAYTVYKHTSPSGKVYIGITGIDPVKRWKQGYSHNKYFTMAIKKYGWSNIKSEILASNLSKEDACEMEILLIKHFRSNNKNFGYNISIGGESGRLGVVVSEESKEKMRKAKIGKKLSEEHKRKISESGKGRVFSLETREKIRVANTGRKHTEEEKIKMSEKATGRKQSEATKDKRRKMMVGENNHFYGKKHTETAKSKVSEKNSKKVVCLETGEVFKSAVFASHCLGLNSSAVSGSINGKSKSAGGFHWKYWEE